MLRHAITLLMLVCAAALSVHAQDDADFTFTLIHTNDEHAHHLPNSDGDGGAARAATVINQIRAEAPLTLLVNGGDRFTGTLFHTQYRGQDSARLMTAMGYQAMALGNHEFDDGSQILADFIAAIDFPTLSANTSVGVDDPVAGDFFPSVVLDVGGEQIGLIGLTTVETWNIARPSPGTNFDGDYASVVNALTAELAAQGVNKIILLSHIGHPGDLALAGELRGVDIIVGAHSHTLLSNTYRNADGEYPIVRENASGDPVLIVQSGANTLYVGRLNVTFDPAGIPTAWNGDSIFLSRYITPDPTIAALVDELAAPLAILRQTVVGQTGVFLVGDRATCRFGECNMGNLVTDALRAETGAQIALMNAGAIRTSIPNTDVPAELGLAALYDVTMDDVLNVLPFANLIATFELSGADLLAALENGVSRVGADSGTGRFPQVSGLRYTFDSSRPAGERIISVEVEQADGTFAPLDPAALYTIASNDFLRTGGDGYGMLLQRAINPYDFGRPLDEVVSEYLAANSPVQMLPQGRIMDQAGS